ncbi:MAG: hypothetical protein AAB288_00600, partial [Acidobacteriota bacterium]
MHGEAKHAHTPAAPGEPQLNVAPQPKNPDAMPTLLPPVGPPPAVASQPHVQAAPPTKNPSADANIPSRPLVALHNASSAQRQEQAPPQPISAGSGTAQPDAPTPLPTQRESDASPPLRAPAAATASKPSAVQMSANVSVVPKAKNARRGLVLFGSLAVGLATVALLGVWLSEDKGSVEKKEGKVAERRQPAEQPRTSPGPAPPDTKNEQIADGPKSDQATNENHDPKKPTLRHDTTLASIKTLIKNKGPKSALDSYNEGSLKDAVNLSKEENETWIDFANAEHEFKEAEKKLEDGKPGDAIEIVKKRKDFLDKYYARESRVPIWFATVEFEATTTELSRAIVRSQRQEAAKCRGAANGAFNKADYEKATNQSSKAMEALMAADDFIKVVSAYQCFPKQYPENADSTDEKIPTLPDLRRLNMKSRYPAVRDAEPRCAEGSKKLESSNLFDKAAAHFALRIAIERFDQALKETRLDEDKRWVEKEQRETRKELDKIKDSVEVLVFKTDKRPLNGILLQDTKSWVFVTDPPEAHLWPMNFEVALAFSIVNKKDHKKIDNSRISKNLDVRVVAKGNDRHDDIVLDFEH